MATQQLRDNEGLGTEPFDFIYASTSICLLHMDVPSSQLLKLGIINNIIFTKIEPPSPEKWRKIKLIRKRICSKICLEPQSDCSGPMSRGYHRERLDDIRKLQSKSLIATVQSPDREISHTAEHVTERATEREREGVARGCVGWVAVGVAQQWRSSQFPVLSPDSAGCSADGLGVVPATQKRELEVCVAEGAVVGCGGGVWWRAPRR